MNASGSVYTHLTVTVFNDSAPVSEVFLVDCVFDVDVTVNKNVVIQEIKNYNSVF